MTYPADGAMLVLMALDQGERIVASDGCLYVTVEGQYVPMPSLELDDLEDRGWVEVGEQVTATQNGRYWLHRWVKHIGMKPGARLTLDASAAKPGERSREVGQAIAGGTAIGGR